MSADIVLHHRLGDFTLDAAFAFGEKPGVTALFGPSGAGKSTIIHAIAGLLRPERGRIALQGETLLDTERGIFMPASVRRVGVVFQDTRLFPHLSVRSNLLYGWRRAAARADVAGIDSIIALLGLESLLARRPGTLSGGERSRVALARALLMGPRTLLLDEPLAALDVARKTEILPYLERLVLADGRVAAEGSLFDVTARLDLFTGTHRLPGAVLEALVARHDESHGLTELAFAGESLVVPAIARELGDKVRIRIDADDVMLALVRPESISANNILTSTIAAIREDGPNADVQLQLKGARLVARITRRSVKRLGLKPGTEVFALIKSVTVGGREQN